MNEEYEQITITTAARRIAGEVNSTNQNLDLYLNADGNIVDVIEHGCWRDDTPEHPFPVKNAVLCCRGVEGAPVWIGHRPDENRMTWRSAQQALNDVLGK